MMLTERPQPKKVKPDQKSDHDVWSVDGKDGGRQRLLARGQQSRPLSYVGNGAANRAASLLSSKRDSITLSERSASKRRPRWALVSALWPAMVPAPAA